MPKGGSFMIIKNETMKALYADDFSRFMSEAGLLESFEKGELRCRYCGLPVERKTLHALVPTSKSWEMCCIKPKCIINFAEDGGNEN